MPQAALLSTEGSDRKCRSGLQTGLGGAEPRRLFAPEEACMGASFSTVLKKYAWLCGVL